MESLLHEIAHYVALTIEVIAILIIAIGTVEAVVGIIRVMLSPHANNVEKRGVWLEYSRWLVGGLPFQPAARVVNTSFFPTWDEVSCLAGVAAIRTFLSYFLDREVEDLRKLQHAAMSAEAAGRLPAQ